VKKRKNENRIGWWLLSPSLVILGLVGIVPFLYVIILGFNQWNVFSAERGRTFVGFANYAELVFDQPFLSAIGRSILFTVLVVGLELVLGFLLAQSLIKDFRGKTIFRTIYILPLVVAPIAVGATWRLMTVQGFGPIPHFLKEWFGIDFNIGVNSIQAWTTIIVMDVWHWTPFVTLTLLAGILAMPRDPIEAAQVDGASKWQIYRHVTIPMLMPIIFITMFIRIMDSLKVVEEVYMLTNGGPSSDTTFVGLHIFRTVIQKTDWGYGSSMSLLVLYFTVVASWLLHTTITNKMQQVKV
jgi:multiple sugar transport system permease protein